MTELEQIGQKISELSKPIYDNPNAFFNFFDLNGGVINWVSISSDKIIVSYRHRVTQSVHSFWVPFEFYYDFVESLKMLTFLLKLG